jgi:putative multiple sugar transport system substrate-binding protein
MALSREDIMKKLTSILATMALGVGLISTPVIAQDKGTVGIAMPTKSSARWISDGNSMVDQFTAAGYATDLQYAEDDIPNQLAQIENMITKGVDVLVIAAIDGTTLSNALENAAASGIKVIAYDRLIRESGNVDYYATFDNFKVGVQQASSLVDGLKARFGDGPYNVELFGGSPDDNNAFFFYNGAMSVLQPMIDSGDIVIVSGQMGMDKVGTLRWDGAVAQARMDNLLSAHYTDKQIHGVLSPYDGLSIGILSSLKGVGYGSGDLKMPIVTGQDAEVPSVKSILADEQYSTVFKDTRELARVTVGMVEALLQGGTPEINDTRPMTMASRWLNPTCSSRFRSISRTGRRSSSVLATTRWIRSSRLSQAVGMLSGTRLWNARPGL